MVRWSGAQLGARAAEALDVYADAMEVSQEAARVRAGVLLGHLDREGFLAAAAVEGEELLGVAYGYAGAPGQWWHDQVRSALTAQAAREWLDGSFEVCELHVRRRAQGQGLGRALLDLLLDGTPCASAVLTTPDADTRARAFYRAGGWVDLARRLHFPGDPRAFAVLGRQLRTTATRPGPLGSTG